VVDNNIIEAVSKCLILFEIKEGENFNHRNTWSISRIKFEPDADIGQKETF
jgi:hypothetical protein